MLLTNWQTHSTYKNSVCFLPQNPLQGRHPHPAQNLRVPADGSGGQRPQGRHAAAFTGNTGAQRFADNETVYRDYNWGRSLCIQWIESWHTMRSRAACCDRWARMQFRIKRDTSLDTSRRPGQGSPFRCDAEPTGDSGVRKETEPTGAASGQ